MDGSPHDWFEGRGPACTLIVFIDDATTDSSSPRRLLALRFVAAETTEAYMETLRGIDGMEAANAYLPEFAADHNRRFAVPSLGEGDISTLR